MINIITEHPLALQLADYYYERSANRIDNTSNKNFNHQINAFFKKKLQILDIGCAGGQFVVDCINDAHFAIGIEGCDYSKNNKRACWKTHKDNLFCCDASKPFTILDDNKQIFFDIITLWDVFEHFKEEELDQVIINIINHLKLDGVLITSIAMVYDKNNPLHFTVKDHKWWISKFETYNLIPYLELNKHITTYLRNPTYKVYIENTILIGGDTFCSSWKRKEEAVC